MKAIPQSTPSGEYSYSDFDVEVISAGGSATLRVFIFDAFRNMISGIDQAELNKYKAYLTCEGEISVVSSGVVEVGATGSVGPHL